MDRLIKNQKIERRNALLRRRAENKSNAVTALKSEQYIPHTNHTYEDSAVTYFLSNHAHTQSNTHTQSQRQSASLVAQCKKLIGRALHWVMVNYCTTDSSFIVAIILSTVILAEALQPHGAIISHTMQPPTFVLPDSSEQNTLIVNNVTPLPLIDAETTVSEFASLKINEFIIRSGQTLSELAEVHNVGLSTLISFNEIGNARSIQSGTTYKVPDRDGILHTVKSKETIQEISAKYTVDTNTILDVNDLQSATLSPNQKLFIPGATLSDFDLRLALGELFAMPTYGYTTSGYGYRRDPITGVRRFHYGVDIAAPVGMQVRSAMEGRVSYIGEQVGGYGKYIIIKHPGGFQTLYAHLNGYNVRSGQYINRGNTIGWMGNTGRSTGSHLHFAIIKNGKFTNPNLYLY